MSENEQVSRHDGCAHVAGKRRKVSPGAAPQPEDAFDEGDDALDARAKVAPFLVDSPALGHLLDRESKLLREGHIDHVLFRFRMTQILRARNAAINGHLPGLNLVDRL